MAYARICALFGLSMPAVLRGDHAHVIPGLKQGLELARETRMLGWVPPFAGLLGYALACTGCIGDGLGLLEEAIRQAETTVYCHRAHFLAFQGEVLTLAGHHHQAESVALQGLTGARARGERGDVARCLLALGRTRTVGPNPETAIADVEEARELGTALGMRPVVAHCHAVLAHVHQRVGKQQQADEHFTAAIAMYREMGMTYWLEKAQRDMRELG
jgi:predicted RNA polymerase sigma factor